MEDMNAKQSGNNASGGQTGGNNSERAEGQQQYKNIETSVNNPDYFNDDYEVEQEDEMRSGEAKSEQETDKT